MADPSCLRPSSQSSDQLSRDASAYLSRIPHGASKPSTSTEVSKDEVFSYFYEPCGFALAWTSHGKPTPQAEAIVASFDLASNKGLEAADYAAARWRTRIADLVKRPGSPEEIASFDLELTVDLLQYLIDLSAGRIGSQQRDAPFHSQVDTESLLRIIASNFVSGADIQRSIESVEPSSEGYRGAETALPHYLDLAKSPDVSLPRFEGVVFAGKDSACIAAVASRLKQLGFLRNDFELKSPTFDEALVSAVRHFQELHGLGVTGNLDRETYQELAIPIRRRAEQLVLTLERWRWVQHRFPEPPIVINIPEFKLRAFDEQRKVALSMRVIVGKAYRRQTPVFESSISSIVFHPYWNVPRDIQVGEIAPKVEKDPNYLEHNGFEVTNSKGDVVHNDSAAVAAGVHDGSLKVRQVPGERNSLGSIKFVFPNTYGVYLHGTPAQVLFSKARRDFSHGCIRAEDPAT